MKVNKYDVVCEKVASYDIDRNAKNSRDVATFLTDYMNIGKYAAETFWVVMLNSKMDIVGVSQIGKGNVTSCPADVSEIFRAALTCGTCATIVIAHNHPSGTLEPSTEDIKVTRRTAKAGKLLGIKLMDHVIVADDRHISMKAEGHVN